MALKDRIIKAHQNGEDFLVYVFIPLLPGFEGDILKSESSLLKIQVMHQQNSIAKGPNSLFAYLEAEDINPSNYIRFYGLRKHDVYKNIKIPVSPDSIDHEVINKAIHAIIYIHSKLMIVDDRKIIIGSANINDRSMLGTRDSEIAVVIEDTDLKTSKMAGEQFRVGKLPHQFRIDLFKGKI